MKQWCWKKCKRLLWAALCGGLDRGQVICKGGPYAYHDGIGRGDDLGPASSALEPGGEAADRGGIGAAGPHGAAGCANAWDRAEPAFRVASPVSGGGDRGGY